MSKRITFMVNVSLGLVCAAGILKPLATAAYSVPTGPYPACSSVSFGGTLAAGSSWGGSLTNLLPKGDGATLDVKSNWNGSSCARGWPQSDGTDYWGLDYQCTELGVRVADVEWNDAGNSGWSNTGWNGAAYDMFRVGPSLTSPLTQLANASTTSLPQLGDLLIFDRTTTDGTGHVAVVEGESGGRVYFVGQNQGNAENSIPYSVSGSGVVTADGSSFIGGTPLDGSREVTGWLRGLTSINATKVVADYNSGASKEDVFWQGANGNLWEASYNSQWWGPTDEGFAVGSNLAVDYNSAASKEDVFWQGANGHLYEASFAGSQWWGPTDEGLSVGGTLTADYNAGGSKEDVFWQGGNGHLYEATYTNQWWGPTDEGLSVGTALTSDYNAGGSKEDVFWQGGNGHLYEATYTNQWWGPTDQGLAVGSTLTADYNTGGSKEDVLWQGGNGHLYEASYTSQWWGPTDEGLAVATGLTSDYNSGSSKEDVFWQGTNTDLWEGSYTNQWWGPTDEGISI